MKLVCKNYGMEIPLLENQSVIFVIENPNSTEVLGFDEEYQLETGERWTIYETYKNISREL